ncbi:DUF302 domain-containing protein [Devosia sp.]|uniref:DUF302 domain-containing protein n=1 Tax=Devosia sp. TaxID=1871048 RepID=UPI0019E4DA2B|nr:DUF302 domain-containing protein [Devosia sp.]MBE0581253.1 DUF302 domain-containing protein [Devosia sp.]
MYTFDKQLRGITFEDAVARTKQVLATKGFGVLTEIDMQKTMKARLDADIPAYVILGACNPGMAYQALKLEPRAGAMLPCNVIVRELEGGVIEVSAIDPVASMTAIDNDALKAVASKVQDLLSEAINAV